MAGRARKIAAQLRKGARMPRRTVRLRLTLLFGALFLGSSAVLLAVTYVVVRNLTGGPYIAISSHGLTIAGVAISAGPLPRGAGATASGRLGQVTRIAGGAVGGPARPTVKQLEKQARTLQRVAVVYHDSELHHLLITYGVALGIMAIVSLGLGWLVAGRILRPLRTITASTRAIGVTDLHRRLALTGPDDELKELGDTVDALLERLEVSFASQKQFVANASHELRTPLARQRTLGEVALSDPGATVESLRLAHEQILMSGKQQEQVIDALLTLSRVQSGALRAGPVDLAAMVEELLRLREPQAAAQALRVVRDLRPGRLCGDGRLVERLAVNLLDNAIRHNVSGGSLMVTVNEKDGTARLCVTNDGPVIQPEDIERLYEPFERLEGSRPSTGEGFGLGLCIVKAVARAHGATLETQARPTGGLRVEIRFPAAVIAQRKGDGQLTDRVTMGLRS